MFILWAMLLAGCTAVSPGPDALQEEDGRGRNGAAQAAINGHCRDPEVARRFRSFGPVYTVGASVSHGLFAESFPKLVADQMCLEKEAYDADFEFLFFYKSKRSILNAILEYRPKIIIALDYPYHHVKLKHARSARPILKNYVTMLLLECDSDFIDCSEDGPHRALREDPYRPMVFAGTVYFDCNLHTAPDHRDKEMNFTSYKECREENEKLNSYYRQLEKQYSNLYLLPAFEILSAFHDSPSGRYRYSINDVDRWFEKEELFFDGFHPRTDPGAYVLANVVIDGINRMNAEKNGGALPGIPYLPIR